MEGGGKMAVNYWLYREELDRKRDSIDRSTPVEMEIMDQGLKIWKQAKVMIFREAVKGSEPVGLLGPFSEPHDEGKYHIKVMEILPSPLED